MLRSICLAGVLGLLAAPLGSTRCAERQAPEPHETVTAKAPSGGGRGRAEGRARVDPAAPEEKSVGYIIGGTHAPPGAFPFAVAIAYRNAEGALSQYCGGALLRPNVVLTAAHCRVAPGDVAIIGRHNLRMLQGQAITIVGVDVHEKYDRGTYQNDIAILRLARSAGPQYEPIQAAKTNDDLTGRAVTAIGWGRTAAGGPTSLDLLETTLPVIAQQECATKYGAQYSIGPGMICAAAPGRDACQGDSGGPLFLKAEGQAAPVQVGITSFGIGCAEPGYPGVYTRVGSYAEWIASHLPK